MDENIKQEAIEMLQEAIAFILISDDGKQTNFRGEGMTLHEAIGLVERYKHKLIDDCYPVYTAPPKRKPLDDDEIVKVLRDDDFKWPASAFEIARAIEKAHGIGE